MPGGKPLRLGPFIGGLNTGSDPTAIADAELVESRNFELDIDGSLVSRPPMQEINGHANFTERIILLCEAIFSGDHYLIGSNSNGVFYYLNGIWGLITNTFQASCAVQYAGKVYLVPHPNTANPGGKWDPGAGFTAVAAIPKGQACVFHKERLFVVPGILATVDTARLKFSDVGNLDSWPGTNFIDVGQGDGTNMIDITVFQDNLVLFKKQSTHVLAYDIKPEEAVVRNISKTIGVDGQFCVANYENQVYLLYNGWVYELVNYDFRRLNSKVLFIRDETSPSPFSSESRFLGLVGDRLVCRFFNRIYVFGLRTQTWSEWESDRDRLHYFGPIKVLHEDTGDEFYAGSCLTAHKTLIRFFDIATPTVQEKTLDPVPNITDAFTRVVANGWGEADTGQDWFTSGGSASDFSVNGSVGQCSLTTLNVARVCLLSGTYKDIDIVITVASNVVATGANISAAIFCRTDASNNYHAIIQFKTDGNIGVFIQKTVAGVTTNLATGTASAYLAAQRFKVRFRVDANTMKLRVWKEADPEPNAWNLEVIDTDVTLSSGITLTSTAATGNTNISPNIQWDNLSIAPMSSAVQDITCIAKTKNFDMAISNQFKRLWWWGADISSNRTITGIATPIVISFNATWNSLATKKWNELETWAQPLTEINSTETVRSTGTGTARRFAKFLKSLRYRQINFQVRLVTDGSSVDGPARLFTMMIVTESKQGVSKDLS